MSTQRPIPTASPTRPSESVMVKYTIAVRRALQWLRTHQPHLIGSDAEVASNV